MNFKNFNVTSLKQFVLCMVHCLKIVHERTCIFFLINSRNFLFINYQHKTGLSQCFSDLSNHIDKQHAYGFLLLKIYEV